MSTQMTTVTLRTVFHWTCPSCGEKNQHNGHAIKDSDLREILDECAVDEDGEHLKAEDFVSAPQEVWCRKCEAKFQTA